MKTVIIETDKNHFEIDNVKKIEMNIAADMFNNKIKITTENGKTRTFDEYEINSMVVI